MTELTSSEPTMDDAGPVVATRACEQCGGPVERWDRFCPSCGAPQEVETPAEEAVPQQRHFRCKNCGAEVAVDPDQRSYVCAFCDSTYVVEFSPETSGRQSPEFVIGFSVTHDQAMEKFRTWLTSNSWFRPGDLIMAEVAEKLRGVYLPFWSFSMLAQSTWSASIGEYWYRTETYTTTENGKTVTKTRQVRETEWWNLAGQHHNYYSGYLVSGSRGLPQGQAERIKPFHLAALRRYQPFFLAGWLSEEYSVERDDALVACQQVFRQWEEKDVAADLPGDTYSNLQVSTWFDRVGSDLVLLPVYLLSYRYRDKLYRFLVNGQTGKVAGDKPLSWRRISVAVTVGVALAAAVALAAWLLGR